MRGHTPQVNPLREVGSIRLLILQAAKLMRERVDEMATAMTLEQGKPID